MVPLKKNWTYMSKNATAKFFGSIFANPLPTPWFETKDFLDYMENFAFAPELAL
jgi:hypothetical protein